MFFKGFMIFTGLESTSLMKSPKCHEILSSVSVFFRVVRVGDGVATLSLRFGAGDFLLERPFLAPMDEDEDAIMAS